jgi:hypothetical protein
MPTVLFIGGFGRSGSTLLERMLGQVPGHTAVGELVHLQQRGQIDDEACGCGKAFSDCELWRSVGEVAFGSWSAVDGWRDLQLQVDRKRFIPELVLPLRPSYRRALRAHAERLGRLYAAIAEVSGAEVIVDSSKHIQTAFLLHHVPGIRPVVVHLVRDSRGVACSWGREVVRPEAADGGLMVQYRPWSAATQWLQYNLLFHTLGIVRTRHVFLRYEDLLADPPGALARVLRAAGLPGSADHLSFVGADWVELEPDHSVAGNPMRFSTGRLALKRDDRWRTELPTGQRRLVTAVTAPLLAAYGYLKAGR